MSQLCYFYSDSTFFLQACLDIDFFLMSWPAVFHHAFVNCSSAFMVHIRGSHTSGQGRESRSSQFSGNQDAAAGGETPDLWFNKTLPPLADHRAAETSYFNSTYLLLTSSINRAIHASLSDWYFPLFPVAFRATNEKTLFWLGLYYSCTKCGRTDLDNYKLEGSDWSWSNLIYLFPF